MDHSIFVIRPSGVLTQATIEEISRPIEEAIAQGSLRILINCQNISFMDSAALGGLVVALKRVRAANAELWLCSLPPAMTMLLELTGLNQVFPQVQDESDFMQAQS